ncbi:glycosyltransferase family 2 protein [Mycoplasmopsis fermentans]|nr:glycosyltransferase family 2 protein [Mycoplasmopsis fermentans]ADN68675.1 putative glycosyltransferase [Mycoplasmopsis fermentans JER]ADV34058.1 Conserved Hypothetical Protein [Mycoplasmopsis fermentans M64]VEU60087.1 putative glucosyl-3-phosphoglycerate synthase [Mycoplasmopsis fermentans]VEU66905.1 putative glucosyl-3-phosphoglycerate synthase [Mesomycoplasma conjunctivae]
MVYQNVVYIVMPIIVAIFLIFSFQYWFVLFFGLFAKPVKFKTQTQKLKYGIVICARNEEKVIAELVKSIKNSQYDQDKLQTFVIAHNCTDKTAEKARNAGAIVYEYSNSSERTKGYALKKIFEFIEQDYGIQSFDGYHIFDADNIVDSLYFEKMNDAFLHYDKKNVITSFRNTKNFGKSIQTINYGLMFMFHTTIESNARMKFKMSSKILGSGFLISNEMVKDGWNITIPSDDSDFTVEQISEGKNVKYCDEAMFYDEQPTKFKDMWRQRLRWVFGNRIVWRKRFKSLIKNIFSSKKEDDKKISKSSSIDILFMISPISFIGFLILLLNILLVSLGPIFGANATQMWIDWAISFSISHAIIYLILFVIGIITYARGRKRVQRVPWWKMIISLFIWPLFLALYFPLQIVAIFKNINKFNWTQIEHNKNI